jgi:glutamyl-Q tRNA(Asp) synthetase
MDRRIKSSDDDKGGAAKTVSDLDSVSRARRIFRFAPSPNGYLHRGHAFSALLNSRAAATTGGRFLLRIEDIDPTRARPMFEAAIYEDLAWLGLAWENPVLRQSERFEAYRKALQELDRLGLLYPAFLSRAEIDAKIAAAGPEWRRDPDGAPLYPGAEREWSTPRRRAEIERGRPYALRLDLARALAGRRPLFWREADPFGVAVALRQAHPAAWGDVVIARKEVPASYHLAVVVDDAFQQITDVARGKDLEAATSVHRLLQDILGLPPPAYFHHRLLLDGDGRKLAKSRGSETLRARRAAGQTPADLIAGLNLEMR